MNTAPPLSANVTAAQGTMAKAPQTGFDKTKAVALPGAEEMAAIHKAKKADQLAQATAVPATAVPDTKAPEVDDTASSAEKEEVKEEAKEEPKVMSKEEMTEDVKEEIKEEPKEEPKEDVKEDSKEETKAEPQVIASDATKQDVKTENDPPLEGVEGLKIKDEEPASEDSKIDDEVVEETQKQDAKDPAAAGESVKD